jgi:PAS domain S-box-containing protein
MNQNSVILKLAENAPSGLVLVNKEKEVIYTNSFIHTRTGYSFNELLGHEFYELLINDEAARSEFSDKISHCLTKPFENFRVSLTKKSQGILSVVVSGSPFSDDGETYIACVIYDMTSRHAYEKVIEAGYDNLQQVTIDLETAINKNRKQQRMLEAYKEKITREIEIAKSVQEAIIPKEFPGHPYIDIWGVSVPSEKLGGDYFDFFQLSSQKIGILIADVAGHGVAASLLTTMLKAYFEYYTKKYSQPERLFYTINNSLTHILRETGVFVTALYYVLDLHTLVITGCNAGHEPPIILYKDTNNPAKLGEGRESMALGLEENTKYPIVTEKLEQGCQLVFLTDGITEARNNEGVFFGYSRLASLLEEKKTYSSRDCIESIISSIDDFYGSAPPNDDRTIIRMHVKSPIECDEIDEKILITDARKLIGRKQYDSALEQLKRIDSSSAYMTDANRLTGKIHALLGNYELAEEYLIKSIDKDDSSIETYYNLGIVKYYLKQYDKAAECFIKVANLSENYKKTDKYLTFINRIMERKS